MARRKKGRPLTGWMVVDKPAGITSAGVVNKAKWALDAQKAGHAGTLDPAATGLLVLAFGDATKVLPCITDALKTYRFTVAWGAATDTDDAEGTVIATAPDRPTPAAIEAALPAFRGDIEQVPPQVSAVKVDGERAYARAREGEVMDLAARPLHVADLRLLATPSDDRAEFEMTCGKGGYVRAIARDLGRALGCLGHVTTLRRTATGPFTEADAVPFDRLDAEARTDALVARILPLRRALSALPECRCTPEAALRLRNGNAVEVFETDAGEGDVAWASCNGQPLALGTYRAGMFQPGRVFNQPG